MSRITDGQHDTEDDVGRDEVLLRALRGEHAPTEEEARRLREMILAQEATTVTPGALFAACVIILFGVVGVVGACGLLSYVVASAWRLGSGG